MTSGAFSLLVFAQFEFLFVNLFLYVGVTAIKPIITSNTVVIQNISNSYFQRLYRTKARMKKDGQV
jgi:hypothetical protein